MFIGGIDIGTTGAKITIYDEQGNFIEKQYIAYPTNHNGGFHEIDANEIADAVKGIITNTNHKPDILGITSFGETFVLVGADDQILLPSMLYTDCRGTEQAQQFDTEKTAKITYCAPHGMYSLPKLMWVKENHPEIYEKTKHIFLMQDFIAYLLTGNSCIDYSLAARTMGFDVRNKCWSKELFSFAGIDPEKMSKPVPCGSVVGISNQFGLHNTTIIAGCHDQVACAIGAGALAPGMAVNGSGTVECVTPVFSSLPEDISICNQGYAFVPYLQDLYVCYAFSFTGGAALGWFQNTFAPESSYRELDEKTGKDPSGLLILPHFAGAATPYMNPNSSAIFSGITLETTKMDLYRAIMEGVVYEMQMNLDYLKTAGISPTQLLATGGGANSPLWLQMKADILNLPITAIDAPEAGTLGTIMLAACTAGLFDTLETAKAVFVRQKQTYTPNPEQHKQYLKLYEKYKKIYDSSNEWRDLYV